MKVAVVRFVSLDGVSQGPGAEHDVTGSAALADYAGVPGAGPT